jgi:hypothetical protein
MRLQNQKLQKLGNKNILCLIQKHVRVAGDDDPHRCSRGLPLTSVVSHTSFVLDHRCWLAMVAHERCD